MKKIGILFAGTLAVLTISACGDDDIEQVRAEDYGEAWYAANATVTSDNPLYAEDGQGGTISFKSTGGTVVLNVDCGVTWYAETSSAGVFRVAWNEDTGSVTVTADENFGDEQRGSFELRTSGQQFTFATVNLVQNAYGAPEISVDTNVWHAPAVGELTTEIAVTSFAGEFEFTWTAGWLVVERTDEGIRLTADGNTSTDVRETEVVLTSDDGHSTDSVTITVTQDGLAYVVFDKDVAFDSFGGTVTVEVESNFEWDYETNGNGDWFSIVRVGDRLMFSADVNDGEARESLVILTAGDGKANAAEVEISVTQDVACPEALVLQYEVGKSGQTIQLPLSGTVSCTVNWGDGDAENVTSTLPTHTYRGEGTYNVSIVGEVTALNSSNVSSSYIGLLTDILQWGNTGLTNMEQAFNKSTGLRSVPADTEGAFSRVTSFYHAFYSCSGLTALSGDTFKYASEAATFEGVFSGCSSLTTLPSNLFDGCTNVTTFYNAFRGCSSLTAIPVGLFDYNTKVTNFANMFYGDHALSEIPARLFANCTNVTDFSWMFYGCEGLNTVPADIFANCSKVTDFSRLFYGCHNLETVPEGLFADCQDVTDVSRMFTFCYDLLKTVPADLFSNCKKVTNAAGVFYGCYVLESIPAGLFDAFSEVTSFYESFCFCNELADVPEDLFKNCTKVTTFYRVFDFCYKLKTLPSVSNCPLAEIFTAAFSYCTALETIPDGFFDNNPLVTDFTSVFENCSALKKIPDRLFDHCPLVTEFSGAFYKCSSLTAIPEGLFDNCPEVTNFSYCFAQTLIGVIPDEIFSHCTNVTDLSYCFAYSKVEGIPDNVFANATLVKNLSGVFFGCDALTVIPPTLFTENTEVTNFYGAFYGCTSLTEIPAGLFTENTAVTNFQYTFCGCTGLTGESPYTVINDNKIHLYERADNGDYFANPSTHTYCFTDCTGLTDYYSIPSSWGGGGNDDL